METVITQWKPGWTASKTDYAWIPRVHPCNPLHQWRCSPPERTRLSRKKRLWKIGESFLFD